MVGSGMEADERTTGSGSLVRIGKTWDGSYWVLAELMVALSSLAESVQPDKSTAVLQVPGSDPREEW